MHLFRWFPRPVREWAYRNDERTLRRAVLLAVIRGRQGLSPEQRADFELRADGILLLALTNARSDLRLEPLSAAHVSQEKPWEVCTLRSKVHSRRSTKLRLRQVLARRNRSGSFEACRYLVGSPNRRVRCGIVP